MRLPFLYTLVGLLLLGIAIMAILIKQQYAVQSVLPDIAKQDVVLPVTYPPIPPEEEHKLQEQIAPLIAAGDVAACEQVKNAMYKVVCINNIALNVATKTSDLSQCQYLDDVLVSRESCEQQVLATLVMEKEDITLCKSATSPSVVAECENSFYNALARKKQDPSICERDSNSDRVNSCINNYHGEAILMAAMTGAITTSTCADLRDETLKSQCDNTLALLASGEPEELARVCGTEAGVATVMGPVCMMLLGGQ